MSACHADGPLSNRSTDGLSFHILMVGLRTSRCCGDSRGSPVVAAKIGQASPQPMVTTTWEDSTATGVRTLGAEPQMSAAASRHAIAAGSSKS